MNEELHYDVALGDLIKNQRVLVDEEVLRNKFSLLNTSLAPIEFDLKVNDPFYFANFESHTRRQVLRPKEKLKVDVLFRFNAEFIQQIDFSESKNILLEDSILVSYGQDITQYVPISAKILAPDITVSREVLDFGLCLVGQERTQQIFIKNPSSSALIWSIRLGELISQCFTIFFVLFYFDYIFMFSIENNENDVFKCDTTSGFMDSNKFFITSQEQLINVYFTAE